MSSVHMLHLERGQDVSTEIYNYLMDKKWASALIINGIGSVSSATIGNPVTHDSPPKMALLTTDEPAEVLGFVGEIFRKEDAPDDIPQHAKDNPSEYVVHIHITLSQGKGNVVGGGYRNATVMRALNIYIQEFN